MAEEGKGATDSENKIELESEFLTELHIQHDLSESNTDEILNENASISGQSVPPGTTNYSLRLVLIHVLVVLIFSSDFSSISAHEWCFSMLCSVRMKSNCLDSKTVILPFSNSFPIGH